MNLREFFNRKYDSDVKIKILLELDLKTIKYLCLISPGCLALCQSDKLWKQKLLKFQSKDMLPTEPLTTADWVNLYSKWTLCYFSVYRRGKFTKCPEEAIVGTHSVVSEHLIIGYCQYHVNPHCTYRMTKGRSCGKQCQKYTVKANNIKSTELGCELYCSICLRKKCVQRALNQPHHVDNVFGDVPENPVTLMYF